MRVIIRDAKIQDIELIRYLSNSCLSYMFRNTPISKKEHKLWFNKHIKDIKIIGDNFGAYWIIDGFITIRLFSQFRNKGIGTEVLKRLMGKSVIFINNHRSIHVHYNAGFKITGVLMEK